MPETLFTVTGSTSATREPGTSQVQEPAQSGKGESAQSGAQGSAHPGIRESGPSGVPVPIGPVLDRRYPASIARSFLGNRRNRVLFHRGDWLSYTGTHFEVVSLESMKGELWRYLEGCREESREAGTVPLRVNQGLVSNVLDGTKAITLLPDGNLPRFLEGNWFPKPEDVIGFQNGLLDVDGYLRVGSESLHPHTPEWLSTNVLPFSYDQDAQCPRWREFLGSVSGADADWERALGMWFGYCLTADTRQHKLALMIGPPRSGKGTIMRVLREMVGNHNVAAPRLASLGGDFGLAPLKGKSIALIPDAHLGRHTDAPMVLEILKMITGEDAVTVNEKGRPQTTMRLPIRFTIAANQLVDLPDPSGALAGRLIILPFQTSFAGREDVTLTDTLVAEVSGIINWSLVGLADLRRTGRLIQPAAGTQIREDFARLSSPIKGFIEDCCELNPDASEPTKHLYHAWCGWCQRSNRQPGSPEGFGVKLQAAAPMLKHQRIRVSGAREYCYSGIWLIKEGRRSQVFQ